MAGPPESGLLADDLPDPAGDPLAGRRGAANEEDRVVAADGPQHLGPAFAVERVGDRLRTAGHGPHDEQLADAVDGDDEARKQPLECRPFPCAGGAAESGDMRCRGT